MFFRFLILLILTALSVNRVNARDYDLNEILKLADVNNNEIKLARSDLQFASAQMREAVSTALPKVNVEMGYNRNFLENKFFFTVTDTSGVSETQSFKASFTNEYQLNATLSQTLFAFGKVGNAIKAAGFYKKYTGFQYTAQYQDVITRVKKAFYQALLLQKVWQVAQQSENSARENYDNIKLKFENGVVSEFELLQAETAWQNAIPETMKARKNFQLAINNLKALVDIPLREEIDLVGSMETFPALPDSLTNEQLFAIRPDYNALLWEKKLQEKRVEVETANYLPTLSGNLTYIYGAQSDRFKLENKNDNIILGVSLHIPIFSGLYTSAQVQKARVDVNRAQTRIAMANDYIRIEMQNIYLRMREALERIQAGGKSVETARRSYEIAESRMEHGLATQLEFKDSRVLLDEAQLNYYSAIYDYLDAYFDWERGTGSATTQGL